MAPKLEDKDHLIIIEESKISSSEVRWASFAVAKENFNKVINSQQDELINLTGKHYLELIEEKVKNNPKIEKESIYNLQIVAKSIENKNANLVYQLAKIEEKKKTGQIIAGALMMIAGALTCFIGAIAMINPTTILFGPVIAKAGIWLIGIGATMAGLGSIAAICGGISKSKEVKALIKIGDAIEKTKPSEKKPGFLANLFKVPQTTKDRLKEENERRIEHEKVSAEQKGNLLNILRINPILLTPVETPETKIYIQFQNHSTWINFFYEKKDNKDNLEKILNSLLSSYNLKAKISNEGVITIQSKNANKPLALNDIQTIISQVILNQDVSASQKNKPQISFENLKTFQNCEFVIINHEEIRGCEQIIYPSHVIMRTSERTAHASGEFQTFLNQFSTDVTTLKNELSPHGIMPTISHHIGGSIMLKFSSEPSANLTLDAIKTKLEELYCSISQSLSFG